MDENALACKCGGGEVDLDERCRPVVREGVQVESRMGEGRRDREKEGK